MPGIVVFGRRWAVGSDDFVFPAAGEIILRAVWFLALLIVLAVHNDDLSTCTNGHLLRIYYIGMIVILPLAMIFSGALMWVSMQGTIIDDRARRHVPSLIVLKLLLFGFEIIWTGIGTHWAFSEDVQSCSFVVVSVVKGATVVGWILLFLLIVGIAVVFDTLGSTLSETPARVQRLWKLRCKLLCCCCNVGSDKSVAFEDAARLIAAHLAGIDFVATDVAAAMILVQRQQERELRRRQMSEAAICRVPYTGPSTSNVHSSWMSVANATAFMKYALASYGWPFFVYDDQCTGPFKLWFRCKCCFCLRPYDNIYGDNCCGCTTAAILEQTHIGREDIFYANYHNRLYEIPFYIVMDHETRSIVISVRGTLSFDDALTDLSADVGEMSVDGVEEAKAHRGILQAASYIANMVNQHHLLEEAFARLPDYNLVIVGHSLGAGAAAILAILLKPKYPQLRCFAYSPPGWLLSLPLTRYAEEFVCSVVCGKDLVPRLGHVTIKNLIDKMIAVVNQSKQPKYKILAGSAWRTIFCYSPDSPGSIESEVPVVDSVGTEPLVTRTTSRQRRSYTEEQTPDDENQSESINYPLYMPGTVLFLEESEPKRGCCGTPTYSAFWMKPESFDEIVVSGMAMLHDHMPNVVYRALMSLNCDSNPQTVVVV